MRSIRGSVVAVSYVLIFLGSAPAHSVTMGETSVPVSADGGNPNLLLVQSAAGGLRRFGVNGACGSSNGADLTSKPTANLCSAGFASRVNGSGPWNWTCAGFGGTTASCSTLYKISGACGSSNGASLASAPTSNLCSAGSASTVAGSGPWNWSCVGSNGGSTATCSAKTSAQPVNGACGSSNGAQLTSTPTTNLCGAGTASTVAGSGPWNWSCVGSNGGTTATCSAKASAQPMNGACGSTNGAQLASTPTTNLCSAGTASTVTGSGPWSWSCAGSNGGATASCSASTGSSGSDPTSGVLPSYNDAYANWKMAGLQSVGGIPTRTTVCATVNPLGGGQDDFTNIQNAINNCPAGEVVQFAAGAFQVEIADLPIQISTGISLRGTGNCSGASSPYCQTSLTVSNGALAYTGGACGTSMSAEAACPNGGPPVIEVAPVAPNYNYSWAQCGNIGSTLGTGCGAATLTADAAQGQVTVSVSSTAKFSVGQIVLIDEASGAAFQTDPVGPNLYGQVWAAPDWLSTSGSPATGRVQWAKFGNGSGDFGSGQYPYTSGSSGCWYSYCDRATAELHKIASIGNGTLTFDTPITIAFRQSGGHNAQVYGGLYSNQSGSGTPIPFLQYAGVENLSVLRGVTGGVSMQFCQYCWLRNVEVGDWYGGGVDVAYSIRSELNTIYVHHSWDSVNNGGEYPIAIDAASTELLLTNSITNFAGKGMVARAGGAGSVFSYNYQDDTMYDAESGIGDYWVDMGTNGSHYSAAHHILFEGNWGDNLDNDNTHGNQVYLTYFRNWGTALRSPFVDPSNGKPVNDATGTAWACGTTGASGCKANGPAPLRAAGPMMHDYWFAFVGNVLGTAGVTTAANSWTYSGNFSKNDNIWMLGWNSDASNPTKSDPNLSSGAFIFRHGDYDFVNGSIADWTSGYSHTLPNSFYLSSQPSFFGTSGANCTYPWPWVTPTGLSPIQSPSGTGCNSTDGLPAKARWDAGKPFVQP
jgi:hypothetical protein